MMDNEMSLLTQKRKKMKRKDRESKKTETILEKQSTKTKKWRRRKGARVFSLDQSKDTKRKAKTREPQRNTRHRTALYQDRDTYILIFKFNQNGLWRKQI